MDLILTGNLIFGGFIGLVAAVTFVSYLPQLQEGAINFIDGVDNFVSSFIDEITGNNSFPYGTA